jgi:hypothetical protein
MVIEQYDAREFTSTYFALRVGLIASCVLVLMAPALAWIFQGDRPPSISDSWYTDARTVFVLGLATSSALLIVVRGDTLSEQTLLNVAGWLGLVVAGAACWPKDRAGVPLPSYDPAVVELNKYAIAALLTVATLVWLIAAFVLPEDLVGAGWHASTTIVRCVAAAYPILLGVGWVAFLWDPAGVAEHVHDPFAIVMFVLLGCVALLRTSWGLSVLDLIGDTPVDGSVSELRALTGISPAASTVTYDRIYAGVAVSMIAVVVAAVFLVKSAAGPGWVLGVETALLLLFAVFWGVQTREAWTQRMTVDEA